MVLLLRVVLLGTEHQGKIFGQNNVIYKGHFLTDLFSPVNRVRREESDAEEIDVGLGLFMPRSFDQIC